MANKNLSAAKRAKNDEFYTQYADIQKEINAYLDYNPNVFRDKVILLHLMIRNGLTLQSFLHKTLNDLVSKSSFQQAMPARLRAKMAVMTIAPPYLNMAQSNIMQTKQRLTAKYLPLRATPTKMAALISKTWSGIICKEMAISEVMR